MKTLNTIELLLSDARGQYIPRDFVQDFDLTKFSGISEWQIEQCQNPDNEWYWDAWSSILDNAKHIDTDGNEFTLYQDGDLWLICFDKMTNDEKQNFGFECEGADCEN
jgi:hypothetical protein